MPREKLHTRVRRQQIAEAALRLIATEGVAGLNLAAVARQVGLVPSGIYRHFKNKDEVFDAVLDALEARMRGIVAAARESSAEPLEQLERVLRAHVKFIREGRAFPRLVFSDEVHAGHPGRRDRMRGIFDQYLAGVAAIIAEGQAQGTVRAEVDPRTAALLFFGTVIPAAIYWHLSDGRFNVTRHAARAWPLFRRSIAIKPK